MVNIFLLFCRTFHLGTILNLLFSREQYCLKNQQGKGRRKQLFQSGYNRIRTFFCQSAVTAVFSNPKCVEEILEAPYPNRIFSDHFQLQVSATPFFGSQAGSCEIGRAEIGELTIDDDHLPMRPRADLQFKSPGNEIVALLHGVPKGSGWKIGVNHSKSYSSFGHLVERLKNRSITARARDVHILEVCRGNPNRAHGSENSLHNYLLVQIQSCDNFGCGAGGVAVHGEIFAGEATAGIAVLEIQFVFNN